MAATWSFGPASLGRGLSASSNLSWEALRGAWLWCCALAAVVGIGSKLVVFIPSLSSPLTLSYSEPSATWKATHRQQCIEEA